MGLHDSRQADITLKPAPSVIDAGVALFSEYDSEFYSGPLSSPREFVEAMFSIMASASLTEGMDATASA